MNLVVIEGVGKKDTIKKYLGSNYEVMATKGHIRDLPVRKLGVNITQNFEPEYEIMSNKKDVVKNLKQKAKVAENIYLATDPDREGEAISWHLAHILGLDASKNIRIVFNEITKNAVTKALQNPRSIDQKLVDAQQARRVLDRLVGYKLSPIISKKIKPKLSAGRVQSVALKLIVDREKEIRNFVPVEYWTLVANLYKGNEKEAFKANLLKYNNKKFKINNEQEKNDVLTALNSGQYVVTNVKKSVGKSRALPPYTTSTMQQDASSKLGFTLKRASRAAQELYEGVSLHGEGKVALVTYIRTDSVRIAPEAAAMAKQHIIQNYGSQYYPKTQNFYKTKALTQDAHEAIRPISLERTPESVKPYISNDNYKLYKLIYERFLASQMSNATYNQVSIDITNSGYTFRATGKTPIFDGYQAVYNSVKKTKTKKGDDDGSNDKLPELEQSDVLQCKEVIGTQKFTKPQARYTESSLVKEMEEKGIGRPATYAATITTLDTRQYVVKEQKSLVPTELGEKIIEVLDKYFSDIINVEFTANMENDLDVITQENIEWNSVVTKFWTEFEKMLKDAGDDSSTFKIPPKKSDEVCDLCGSPMLIRTGRYGEFLACSDYPNCKNVKSLYKPVVVATCPKCGGNVIERKSKRGTIFYGCSNYPKCDFISWDKPLDEKCPECESYLTEKTYKNVKKIKCSNNECSYSREEKIEQETKSQ